VTYDNNVNPKRTNTVWMLLYQDYSVNNPNIDDSPAPVAYGDFNAFRLPRSIITTSNLDNFFTPFQRLVIHYSCSCTPPDPKAL
jgi:hypothetical protein